MTTILLFTGGCFFPSPSSGLLRFILLVRVDVAESVPVAGSVAGSVPVAGPIFGSIFVPVLGTIRISG